MYHKAVRQVCETFGKKYSRQLESQLSGATDREVCKRVVEKLRLPVSTDEFEAQLADFNRRILPSAPIKKGVERLLTHLHEHHVPLALATNSTEQAVRLHVAARPKFFGMFHHKVSVTDEDVDRGKPHPDLYLVAASRFPDKPKPKDCLVFEDSLIGVRAALSAGMQVVMIPDKRIEREKTREATMVLSSLMDFKPQLFGLPAFN